MNASPRHAFLLASLAVATLSAVACQPTGAERGDESGCVSCHMPEYRKVRHPVHEGVKPTTCGVCHTQEDWRPATVVHDWWPLTGAHVKADCNYCHKGTPQVFKGTNTECVGCHREDYDGAKFHARTKTATTCNDCHTTSGWKPVTHRPEKEPPDAGAPVTAPTADAGAKTQPPRTPPRTTPPPARPTATPVPDPIPVPVPTRTPVPTPIPKPDVT
ncbi:MAG: hypothetical protein HOO96_08070, partial [Polyangiaceae bacterium]|nr:hypothetical protein [Polyangiaceae bacterium]